MSTTILESGANEPSGFSVSTPSTPFDVRTASVVTRFAARCSSTFTVASPLNGVATNRTVPAGSAAFGDALATPVVAAGAGAAGAHAPTITTASTPPRHM